MKHDTDDATPSPLMMLRSVSRILVTMTFIPMAMSIVCGGVHLCFTPSLYYALTSFGSTQSLLQWQVSRRFSTVRPNLAHQINTNIIEF
jgi:sensor domain CHASE-containing protein